MKSGSSPAPGRKSLLDDETFEWVAAWLVGVVTILHAVYYAPRVVDDAFISLRYADNLVHGHGAVFNAGERVEGYSGPSWMLLQALGLLVGAEGVTWTKVLGLLSLFALEYGVYRMARDLFGVSSYLALVGSLLVGMNSYVVDWAVLGLETPLHLALMVWCPVAVHAFLAKPRKGTRRLAIAAVVGLATTRPESLMYVAICLVAPVITGRSTYDRIRTARRLLRVALPAGVILLALLALRFAYYGHPLPQTYYAKGRAVTLDLERLAPLVRQGATAWESVVVFGGTLLLLVLGLRRRVLAPALMVLACTYFTASVSLDWMPNLRHLLPVTVLAPVGLLALADLLIARGVVREALGWGCLTLLGLAAQAQLRVDSRISPYEHYGERAWVRPKTMTAWRQSLGAFRHAPSQVVRNMGDHDMGQITQAWGVLEASREPVEDAWFIGRDIGAVGYYTHCKVYDTEALFTPSVSDSKAWRDTRAVDDALILRAMQVQPIAGEIYDAWPLALGRHPELVRGATLRWGSPENPGAFVMQRAAPTREEVVRRYEDFVGRFPRWYWLHTLYGEPVGEAVVKRLGVVRAMPPG